MVEEVRVNIPLLKGKIAEKSMNVETLAQKIGVDKGTLYKHLNNGGFNLREIQNIARELPLTRDEAMEIFFTI